MHRGQAADVGQAKAAEPAAVAERPETYDAPLGEVAAT
jgi:hypothetical protein